MCVAKPPVAREQEPTAPRNRVASSEAFSPWPPARALSFAAPKLISLCAREYCGDKMNLFYTSVCDRQGRPIVTDNGAPRTLAGVIFAYGTYCDRKSYKSRLKERESDGRERGRRREGERERARKVL